MNMLRIFSLGLIIMLSSATFKSDKPAYMLFTAKGKSAKYQDLLKDALKADVILFGELHNNPICHWLQFELTRDLHREIGNRLVLAAEMFEADDQLLLDEYTSGMIRQRNFEDEVKLWKNYSTDYKPLVEFAREKRLKFVASNIPRRYASMVHQGGFEILETLSADARKYIAPLPVPYDPELPGYKNMLDLLGSGGSAHASPNLPKAQAIKDATMAYFIIRNRNQGEVVLHFNGTYHSNNYEGIVWYLRQYDPSLNILTIASVEQDTIDTLSSKHNNLADYILCIPSSMTKTH